MTTGPAPARYTLQPAEVEDLPPLQGLIERSVRTLSRGWYAPKQVESALRYVFGVDTALIGDGTYFVVRNGTALAACGGWSRRRTLYGGDQSKPAVDTLLDPARDAARIRAFFVAPECARRGLGRMLLAHCMRAAWVAGFRRLELLATLPGVPLYASAGFLSGETVEEILPDGVRIAFVRMHRMLDDTAGGVPEAIPPV